MGFGSNNSAAETSGARMDGRGLSKDNNRSCPMFALWIKSSFALSLANVIAATQNRLPTITEQGTVSRDKQGLPLDPSLSLLRLLAAISSFSWASISR